jgi:hypothetical protein
LERTNTTKDKDENNETGSNKTEDKLEDIINEKVGERRQEQ